MIVNQDGQVGNIKRAGIVAIARSGAVDDTAVALEEVIDYKGDVTYVRCAGSAVVAVPSYGATAGIADAIGVIILLIDV